jgi:hypothetical protein
MKNSGKILLILLISMVMFSCQKEEVEPEIPLIEKELREFISANGITQCTIREFQGNAYWEPVQNSPFRISNGFIIARHIYLDVDVNLNLNFLYSFRKHGDGVMYMEFIKY